MTRPQPPADWQLPAGVNRGLWDYLHNADLVRNYDAGLVGSSLFEIDREFVERHCPGPGRLIDLGCGTGRLLLTLAQKGWRVLGVDLSPEMLRVAYARAIAAGVAIDLLQANLVELDALADSSFDHAACLFSTLGMVMGETARQRVVAHAYRLVRPGGRFVLHVHNRWFHLYDGAGRRWLLRDSLRRWRGDRRAGDRTMPVHQGVTGLTLHLFSRGEARSLLRRAGFRVVRTDAISLRADSRLRCPWWFSGLRAYGFLLVGEKPS